MTIPVLEANSYQRTMCSGRTKPCIFICGSNDYNRNNEYVVKLKAGIEIGVVGLAAELIASQLATYFDLATPAPALIKIDPLLANSIPEIDLATRLKNSIGLNFGSSFLRGGYETWPVNKSISANLKTSALEIFAFDALIQNPDRRPEKPNILWKGDELYMIDHELAFSFMLDILPKPKPWLISELDFLRSHLFFSKLKGQPLELDRFAGVLESVSSSDIKFIVGSIPEEWNSPKIALIENHILEVCNHGNEFIDQIRRVLYENPV